MQAIVAQSKEDLRVGDVVLEENVSDKTEYVKDVPVDAALIGQVGDWRADSQTPVATDISSPRGESCSGARLRGDRKL